MKLNKRLLVGLFFPALILTVGSLALMPPAALAHEGHAGKKAKFVAKKVALKAMLPAGAKIAKRKERLSGDAMNKAKLEWEVELDRKVHTYYLARDRQTGETLGTAMVTNLSYRHGEMELALGLNPEGRITKAAVLSIDSKYIPDLEKSIGKGFLSDLQGKSIDDLQSTLQGVAGDDWAAKDVLARFRSMIAVLRTFRQGG